MKPKLMLRCFVAACAATAVAAGCGGGGSSGPGTSAREGKIVFQSNRDGYNAIYIMNPDGSGQRRVTRGSEPTLSPNRSRIAFLDAESASAPFIATARVDGSDKRILESTLGGSEPAFSPDGKKIAFVAARDGTKEIFTVNADGSGLARLTDNGADDVAPHWGRNNKIVFQSNRDGNAEIYVMNADGSGQRNVTNSPTEDRNPNLSPNGDRVVFSSFDPNGGPNTYSAIFFINTDGGGRTLLSAGGKGDSQPVFSPNARRIVFVSGAENSSEIVVINADSTALIHLTNNSTADQSPDWR